MSIKLKSFKVLQISANGSVYFGYSVYLKTFKNYGFLNKNIVFNSGNKKTLILTSTSSFYKRYLNQIFKNLIYEFTVNCKKC
jgi:hypothetical protein